MARRARLQEDGAEGVGGTAGRAHRRGLSMNVWAPGNAAPGAALSNGGRAPAPQAGTVSWNHRRGRSLRKCTARDLRIMEQNDLTGRDYPVAERPEPGVLSTAERTLYVLGGLIMAAAAAKPRPNVMLNILALGAGSYLAWRGAEGTCPLKAELDKHIA